jgi:thiol-disulfide isomerase/thioredoxin
MHNCINCIRTIPYLVEWNEKYVDKGLVIVGVHAPEFEFEKNIDNVKEAVKKFGIKYPVIQDNDKGTWNAYENQYWPQKYIVDHEGYIRYDHIGEGGYSETEEVIHSLL